MLHLYIVLFCQVLWVGGTWVALKMFSKSRSYLTLLEMVQRVFPFLHENIVSMRIFLMARPVSTMEQYEHLWYTDILEQQYLDCPQYVRPYVEHLISHGNLEKASAVLNDPVMQPQWIVGNHDRVWIQRMNLKIHNELDGEIPARIPLKF